MTAKTPKQKGLGAMERLLRSGRAVAARTIMTPNAANPKVQPKVTIHTRPPETGVALTTLDPNTPDDLTKIRRIDAALAERLNKLGIIHFDQIANWSATDVRSLRAALRLGNEIHRHAWIEQAAQLALRRAKAIGGLHPERPASTAPPPAYEKPDDQVPTPHHASDQYPAAERQAPQPEAPQAEAPPARSSADPGTFNGEPAKHEFPRRRGSCFHSLSFARVRRPDVDRNQGCAQCPNSPKFAIACHNACPRTIAGSAAERSCPARRQQGFSPLRIGPRSDPRDRSTGVRPLSD